jgi:glycosyltransferase involved in cell wall biosynthesis
MPSFSIIIPTLNSSKTLSIALDSILKQSFINFEILIIDGLSTDKTIEIAKSYNDERIRIFCGKDKGIYDAMNKGIDLATGTWIYFLGSDDWLYNENVLAKIFCKTKTKHINVIYGNVVISGDAGWAKDSQIYDGEFSLSKLIRENICHQAIFYNKAVFEKYGIFNTKYNVCADYDMNFRLWASYSFYYIETIVAVFKGGNTSYRSANNYTNTEKWLNIVSYFKFNILSSEFSAFSQNFITLSCYYNEKKKYFKSYFFKIIFYLHKVRKHFINFYIRFLGKRISMDYR